MTLNYILLLVGLICLGIPAPVFCSKAVRERLRHPVRRRENGLGSLCRSVANWFDLLRAAAFAWLIQHVMSSISAGQDELASAYLAAQVGMLSLCVLAQTLWIDDTPRVVGPVFFLTGLTLVASGPIVGGLSLALGFSISLMLGRLSLVFYVVPVCIAGIGVLLGQAGMMLFFNAAAFLLPAFLAFARGDRLAYARRSTARKVRRSRRQQLEPQEEVEEMPLPEPEVVEPAHVLRPDFAATGLKVLSAEVLAYESSAAVATVSAEPPRRFTRLQAGFFARSQ